MTGIKFYKMEGAGNDFVVIDNRELGFSLEEIISYTPKICDRKFGVGADGLLALENAQLPNVDYTMLYRNADGSDAGMCGNGSRCLTLFAATHGFETSQTFNVHDSIYKAEVDLESQSVSVSFPDVESPQNIILNGNDLVKIYTGTEHVVKFVSAVQLENEEVLIHEGSSLRYDDSLNPPGTNVNFVCSKNNQELELQTYERGVENLTLACGTGAIASAIATHSVMKPEGVNFEYTIKVKGGVLRVPFTFNKEKALYKNIKLIGPATFVFEGKINV